MRYFSLYYTFCLVPFCRHAHSDVVIKDDWRQFLKNQYASDHVVESTIKSVIRMLESKPTAEPCYGNKVLIKMISNGFLLKREDRNLKDLICATD